MIKYLRCNFESQVFFMGREVWKPGNMLYPLPAVMVSCERPGEKPNIITIAWTGTICSDPAMLYVSVRKERYSHAIIKESGEFVVNLVGEEQMKAMDWCGVRSGRDYDKFKECGLTAIASQKVNAPTIAECPVAIECKVKQVIELGSHDMFIAEVIAVAVDDRYMDEQGRFCMEKAKLIAYNHGDYHEVGKQAGKFGYSVEKPKTAAKRCRAKEKK